jgi:hypothetical protein
VKPDGLPKILSIAFVIALVLYAVTYFGIEHPRNRKGPWQVTFTTNSAGSPTLLINQPALAITNVQITFPDAIWPTAFTTTQIAFNQPRPVPYDLPFGKCVFMDTTFLPGTIALEMFNHQIQLIPRVLTLDGNEIPWRSQSTYSLSVVSNDTPHLLVPMH